MKKRLICLLAVLMLVLPLAAQAGYPPDTEESWNRTARYRTTRAVTLYSHYYTQDTWYTPEEEEAISVFTPIGTLPAGKWINVISSELCGKREVFYWDGGRRSAWIDADAYTRDTVQITSTTGQRYSIPRKAYGDAAAVRYILSEYYSDAEIDAFIDGMRLQQSGGSDSGNSGDSGDSGNAGNTGSSGSSGSGGSTGDPVPPRSRSLELPVITLTTMAEDGTIATVQVEMVQPGLLTSVVILEGREESVPTAALSWERGGAEYALAIIYAPKSGVATMWQTDTGKNAICKLKAGSVVLVLEAGGKYTMVMGEGKVGYVISSALTLTDPAEEGMEVIAARKLTLRLEARARGRSLISIPKGARVTVLAERGRWTLVEYKGFAGYVESEYLKE